MNTSRKLFLGFVIIICLAIVVGAIGITGMQRLQRAGVSMYENQVHSLDHVGRAATKFREIRRMFNQVVTNSWYDDKKGALDAKERYEQYIIEFADLLEESYQAASINETDEFSIFYNRIMQLFHDETIPLFNDAISACIYDIPDHYNKLYIRVKMSSINKVTDQIEEMILGMMDLNSAVAKQTSLDNTATTQVLIILQTSLLAGAVVAAMIIAILITRSIAVPIHESAAVLSEISKGNFHARVKGNYKGELGLIKDTVNHTAQQLALYMESKMEAERAFYEANIAKEREDAIRVQSVEFERKMHWYESILDSIHSPLTVTDLETKWTFVNKAVESMLHTKREELYGKTCDHWNAGICNTEQCGIQCALRGVTQTQFSQDGNHYLVNVSVLKDKSNEDVGFIEVVNDISEIVLLQRKTEEQNQTIMHSIKYASKIQKNILPLESDMEKAFSEHSVIWKPRDVVGGDIYWMKQFDTGTVLAVADCTGHGTPGALLTMLVVSALENVVLAHNCHDTADIIWELERRLVEVFSVKSDGRKVGKNDIRDGCDLAVLFIANDGNVNLSAGHTNVYVCDGQETRRIKGQKLYVGEGKITGKDEIKMIRIPYNPDNKFYITSDGLTDQSGWEEDLPFGYRALGEIALCNHHKPLPEITEIIWAAFEKHRGDVPMVDDFELVAFRPATNV